MFRFVSAALVAVLTLTSVSSAFAEDNGNKRAPIAPSKAVADAWAREAGERPVSKALKGLQAIHVGLQAADMWTTIAARQRGAREVNPLMDTTYGKATAFKALMTAGTLLVSRKVAKKNPKAAMVTMVVVNALSAAVVANNLNLIRR